MKKAYKEDNDPVMGSFYDRRQHAYKIKLNDVYGVFAINGWRYTDGNKFISKAITLTGQRLLQESITNMNDYLNNELGNETPVDYIVTSDTDSLFIQCKDLLKARHPDIDFTNQEDVIKKILVIATELQAMANKFIGEFARDAFNLGDDTQHYFELKQEVVLDRGYFAGKRRYAQHIVNKEGVPTDELDVKGLDLMKSNFPPLFKKFGEHLINEIMFGKPKSDIDKQILDFRASVRTIDWRKILKPTGLKILKEYIASAPRSGEVFSKLGLKCPINTKAAIFYNDILRFKGLDKKFPTFQIGDKMYIAYLKDNPYRIDVVGFNGYNDPPEIMEFIENVLIENKIDVRKINSIQLITIAMEVVEKNKDLKGSEKKDKVINIIKEFATNDNNIISKCGNNTTIEHLNMLLSNELVSDVIENIIYCAEGAIELNKKIKSSCFCFNLKKK
jgi:hypothetical protein